MKTIDLRSMDEQIFTIDVKVARRIQNIRQRMDNADENDNGAIHIPTVNGYHLENLLTWAEHYGEVVSSSPSGTYQKSDWDKNFVSMEFNEILELMMAAVLLEFWECAYSIFETVTDWFKNSE